MKSFITVSLLVVTALTWFILDSELFSDDAATAKPLSGHVVTVIDGDSVELRTDSGMIRVELAGLDAPELSQPYGEMAAYYLSDLIKGRPVQVEVTEYNDHGNAIGELFLDSLPINQLMLSDGYAWALRGRNKDARWIGLETLARNSGLGLWRDENPTSPWEYRELISQS
jgi:endonuclease YncB( thermonuclease family)